METGPGSLAAEILDRPRTDTDPHAAQQETSTGFGQATGPLVVSPALEERLLARRHLRDPAFPGFAAGRVAIRHRLIWITLSPLDKHHRKSRLLVEVGPRPASEPYCRYWLSTRVGPYLAFTNPVSSTIQASNGALASIAPNAYYQELQANRTRSWDTTKVAAWRGFHHHVGTLCIRPTLSGVPMVRPSGAVFPPSYAFDRACWTIRSPVRLPKHFMTIRVNLRIRRRGVPYTPAKRLPRFAFASPAS